MLWSARAWRPAQNTDLWTSRLRSGSAHCNLALAIAKKQCPLRILKKMMMQKFKPCWLKLGRHLNKHLAVLVQHTRIASRRLTHPSTTVDHQRIGPVSGKAAGEKGPIGGTTNGRATMALIEAHNGPNPQKEVLHREMLKRDRRLTSVIVVFKDH